MQVWEFQWEKNIKFTLNVILKENWYYSSLFLYPNSEYATKRSYHSFRCVGSSVKSNNTVVEKNHNTKEEILKIVFLLQFENFYSISLNYLLYLFKLYWIKIVYVNGLENSIWALVENIFYSFFKRTAN